MPDRHDWSRNELPLSSFAYNQPAFEYDPLDPLFTSPITSLQDLHSYSTSDGSYSRQAHTLSLSGEDAVDVYPYTLGFSSSPLAGDAGMLDDNWDAAHYLPRLEHGWVALNGDTSPASDLTLHAEEVEWPAHGEAYTQGAGKNIGHLSAPWCSLSWNTPWSGQESPAYGSPSYGWSPVLPSQHEQSVHRPYHDSAGPHMAAMQQSDSYASVSSVWDSVHSESFIEGLHNVDLSETWEMARHIPSTELEPENFQSKSMLGPVSEISATCEPSSRSVCSRCPKRFSHSADLTRHMKTQHGLAGRGYRCAFPGCPKLHKVWTRLDSFKKHVKQQHQVGNISDWVEKSATGDHGLPISMTSLSRPRVGSTASQVHHSVSL